MLAWLLCHKLYCGDDRSHLKCSKVAIGTEALLDPLYGFIPYDNQLEVSI